MAPPCALHAQTTDKLLIAVRQRAVLHAGLRTSCLGARVWRADPHNDRYRCRGADRRVLVYRPKAQLLLATTGRGFAAEADELLAETRKGRGVMTTKPGVKLAVVREIPPSTITLRWSATTASW
jgi:topoisomerase-4 subunit A